MVMKTTEVPNVIILYNLMNHTNDTFHSRCVPLEQCDNTSPNASNVSSYGKLLNLDVTT